MKKITVLIISILAVSLLCGCSAYKLDLTVSEHDKIAEYAAYALLSNSKDYKNKLLTEEEVNKILAERALEDKIKQEMENLNNQATTTTTKPQNPVVPDENQTTTIKPTDPAILKNISDIMGIKNVTIQYAGYELCKIFPNDVSELVVLKAKDDKQFVALSFVLQNTANSQTDCDILGRDILYRLHLSNGKTYKAMITFMNSDFVTWNMPLRAQSMNMAFMVFEVPDTLTDKDFVNMELSFVENKITRSVVLQ